MSSSELFPVVVGSFEFPARASVRDYRLRKMHEGTTPLSVALPEGVYEIELRNGSYSKRWPLSIDESRAVYDFSHLTLPIDTRVPINGGRSRLQSQAELATILSACLLKSRSDCGLAVIALPTAGNTLARVDLTLRTHTGTGLDKLEPLSVRKTAEGAWGMVYEIEPGGHVLSAVVAVANSQLPLSLPIWAVRGFQTLVFYAVGAGGALELSIHMTPMGAVWTGFDRADIVHEFFLQELRMGGALSPAPSDVRALAVRNPLLGMILAGEADSTFIDAQSWAVRQGLLDAVPAHPDAQVLAGSVKTMAWPPSTSRAYEKLLGAESVGVTGIPANSLAETISADRVVLGPWTVWRSRTILSEGVHSGAHFESLPDSHALGIRGWWTLFRALYFRGRLRSEVAERLRQMETTEPATARVQDYLSSIADLRGIPALRRLLRRQGSGELARATSLSARTARIGVTSARRYLADALSDRDTDRPH